MTTNTTTETPKNNDRYALYKFENGKKLYLVYGPELTFAKRGRNPYSWKFERNALKYQAELAFRGIETYLEIVPAYVPKNPYGPRNAAPKTECKVDVIVTPTPFEMIQAGNLYVEPFGPLRDYKGRFIKKAKVA